MAKKIDFRVALDPKVHLGLEVLAAQKHVSMRDLASAIIWQGISPAARSFAEQSGIRGEELPEVIVTQESVDVTSKVKKVKTPEVSMDVYPERPLNKRRGAVNDSGLMASGQLVHRSEPYSFAHKPKRKGRKLQLRISKNYTVQAQIKKLWETTDLTREKIADSVGYPRATVQKWIITCLENNTLKPRA